MRKELWDIACDRWDEDDAKALYKVFSDHYDDEHWDEFCSLAFIGTEKQCKDFILQDFIELYEVDERLEYYLDDEKIIKDHPLYWLNEDVTTEEGYSRTVLCREFQIGGTMEDITVDYELKNALSFNDKEYLARQWAIILLDGYYKDQIDIFAGYIADAWSHEGSGVERFEEDVNDLLDDAEMGETILNFLKFALDKNK